MEKSLLLLLLIYKSTLLSQTILTSLPLDLKNTKENNQIINAENTKTHDVFAFIADDLNITILKYNNALFLTDRYTCSLIKPDCKLIGYSFSEDGNPILYWSSTGLRNIFTIKYYLKNKTYKILNFSFPFSSQYMITQFQNNNLFYILSIDKYQQALIVHTFNNGKTEEKTFNFSSYKFQDENTQPLTFNQLIGKNPIEKIEIDNYNFLSKSIKKSKLYILKDCIILTLDHDSKKTQTFTINLENHDLNEKNFKQPTLHDPKKTSNSFYQEGKLYQVSVGKSELLFDIKDYNSSETIKSIKVLKNNRINFKNSLLLIQKDNRKPTELKKTRQFLRHLYLLNIGLSVFKNKQNTFITIGGIPKIYEPYSNYSLFEDDFPPIYHSESVYFESILNGNFEFIHQEEQPLAIDNILYFLSVNKKISLKSIFKFKDYYILGYYNNTTKQYIMRKFADGFN